MATARGRSSGGSATASGMDFQAVVTAIAGVHLISGDPLGWAAESVDDTPLAVWAETGGPGDDLRFELRGGTTVEVQVKRGLRVSSRLWDALIGLARGVDERKADYGVLVVSPDSSASVADRLSRGIRRVADGRTDALDDVTQAFVSQLEAAGLDPQQACQRIRISVVPGDGASIVTAKDKLSRILLDESRIAAAWNRLYRESVDLARRRGRWEATAVVRMLAAEDIRLSEAASPGGLLSKLTRWVSETNAHFSLFGVKKPLSMDDAWLPLELRVAEAPAKPAGKPETVVERYHQSRERRSAGEGANISAAVWVGRFHTRAVVVGGPGLGKSTLLRKVARRYAEDGFPVLKVRLNAVAARMSQGSSFAESVFELGMDGSGLSRGEAASDGLGNWVLLCDGLDECGPGQERVAEGLRQFAAGHPGARVVVTTRPVGYSTATLAQWRHYDLLPLERERGEAHLGALLRAAVDSTDERHATALETARSELRACASSSEVSGTPLLIGLAASVLANGGRLAPSKGKLYQDLLDRVAETARERASGETDGPLLTRVLDVLGWLLVHDPVSTLEATLGRCAAELAAELQLPELQAKREAARCLKHWEDVGLVERVHHGPEAFLTFVHRTFAEFAAARYLRGCGPDKRRAIVAAMVEKPGMADALRFAGMLGLTEVVVEALVANRRGESLELALEMVADPDVAVSGDMLEQVVRTGFGHIEVRDWQEAFAVGCGLADVAAAEPAVVGPLAADRLGSRRFPTRLIAWTCAVQAGMEYYHVDEAASTIRNLAQELKPGLPMSFKDVLAFGRRRDRQLIETLALGFVRRALDVWPGEDIDRYVAEELKGEPFASGRFEEALEALYADRGRTPALARKPGWTKRHMEAFGPDSEFARAWAAAGRALVRALVDDGDVETVGAASEPPLQLSAFERMVGFATVSAQDVWAWTTPYDEVSVREVVQGVLKISPVDRGVLQNEVRWLLHQAEAADEPSYRILGSAVSVDVPEPEWSAVGGVEINWELVERALNHESLWVVEAAVDLLSGRGGVSPAKAGELLSNGSGYGLAAAAHLAAESGGSVAIPLLKARLEGDAVQGFEYLFAQLDRLEPEWGRPTGRSHAKGTDGDRCCCGGAGGATAGPLYRARGRVGSVDSGRGNGSLAGDRAGGSSRHARRARPPRQTATRRFAGARSGRRRPAGCFLRRHAVQLAQRGRQRTSAAGRGARREQGTFRGGPGAQGTRTRAADASARPGRAVRRPRSRTASCIRDGLRSPMAARGMPAPTCGPAAVEQGGARWGGTAR